MSENQQSMSAEEAKVEIEKIRKDNENLKSFYNTQMDMMKTQLEFENMRADIKEAQLRSLIAEVKMANIMAPPPSPEDDKIDKSSNNTRPLKRPEAPQKQSQ